MISSTDLPPSTIFQDGRFSAGSNQYGNLAHTPIGSTDDHRYDADQYKAYSEGVYLAASRYGPRVILSSSTNNSPIYHLNWTNSDLFNLVTAGFCAIPKLDDAFSLESENEIHQFLEERAFLVNLLNEFASYINVNFRVESTKIRLYVDSTYNLNSLILNPEFNIEDLDTVIAIENTILDNFFYPRRNVIQDLITLAL